MVKDPVRMEGQLLSLATTVCTTNRWPLNETRGATLSINPENELVDRFPPIVGTAKRSSNTSVATMGAS